MPRLLRLLLCPALLAGALAAPAAAEVQVPENDGWVTDLAGLLDERQERELELLMESYRTGSGHEIALLTVPDLGGETIERFALEVGRAWGIGQEGVHDGALLVVSRGDRKVRIEVGRGLEGALPDALCGRLIRNVIVPRFKQGDFPGGIRAGIEALHAAAGGDLAPIERSAAGRERDRAGGVVATVLMMLVILIVALTTRGRGRGLGGSPWVAGTLHGGSFGRGGGFGGGGGGFGGFGGGGGFSGGGASGGW